jgi:hypothetical protein
LILDILTLVLKVPYTAIRVSQDESYIVFEVTTLNVGRRLDVF